MRSEASRSRSELQQRCRARSASKWTQSSVYVYDLLENSKPNLSDLDYTLTGSDLYEVKKLASDRLEEICREKNVPAGKAFTFEVFSYCGEERIDGDEGSATWNGSEVVIDL